MFASSESLSTKIALNEVSRSRKSESYASIGTVLGILFTTTPSKFLLSIQDPLCLDSTETVSPTMDPGLLTTSAISKEDTEKIMLGCAEACGVGRDIVERFFLPSEEQAHRIDHHISTGSYTVQMVLHYEGIMNHDFLLRCLSAMRSRNHILRTRLIKFEGRVYQVLLNDSVVFRQVATSLPVYLTQNAQARTTYGAPLCRYGFVQEPKGESFFVWSGEFIQTESILKHYAFSNVLSLESVHCSAVDAW